MSKLDRMRPGSGGAEHDASRDAGGSGNPVERLAERFGSAGAKRILQRRAQARAAQDAGGGAADVEAAADKGLSGSGGALPHGDRIQESFGPDHDIGHVQAHTDGAAQEGAKAMGAEAFATGDRVAFGGAPDLHTAAHEAAHVVQQRAGVHLKGGVGQEGDEHERHADDVADAVVAGRSAAPLLDRYARPGSGGGKKIQRKVAMPGGKVLDKPTAENVQELLDLAGVDGGRTRAAREEAARLISDAETHSMGQATSKINRAASTSQSRDAAPASSSGGGSAANSTRVGGGAEGMSAGQRAMKSEADKGEAKEELESEADEGFDQQRERSDGDAPEPAHRQAQFGQLMERTSGPLEMAKDQVEAIREKLPFTFAQQRAAGKVDIALGALNIVWGAINIALTAATGGLSTAITAPIGAAIASGGKAAQEKMRQQNTKATVKSAAKEGVKKGAISAAGQVAKAAKEGGGQAAGAGIGGVAGELLPHMIPFVGGAASIAKGLKLIYDGIKNPGDIGPAADKQKLADLDGIAAETQGNLSAMRAARSNPDFRGKESAIGAQIDALAKFLVAAKALRELYLERMVDQGKAPTRGRSSAVSEAAPATRGRSGAISGEGPG